MFESRFQTFSDTSDSHATATRLAALRAQLKTEGIDAFLVPRADEHQGEYVPKGAERLAWLTGFTGSAGLAIVDATQAVLFVDGRYTLQVRQQIDTAVVSPLNSADITPDAWIEANLKPGQVLGYDSWLHTPGQVARFQTAATAAGGSLKAVGANPIDAIWPDRPPPPLGTVALYPTALAGIEAADKLKRVVAALKHADALLVSDPHSLAWAFNIRGADVPHTPLMLGFALIPRDGLPTLFLDARKISSAVRDVLSPLADIAEPAALVRHLDALGRAKATVRFDAATVPERLTKGLEAAGGKAVVGADPIALMKAAKTEAELAGSRAAHKRDGAALVRFLAWFDREAATGMLSEIDATQALETFRRDTGELRDVSFPTIAGAGPNAAIPHYRVTEGSNRRIEPGLFLVDSGAQYQDGTTDITRTIAVGTPDAEMRDRFTRVLQGHIAIARAVFPEGTSGAQIDGFARQALWTAGLDFDHGTGHGVGAFLSVHEGPARISKLGTVPLEAGMILSNEPAYYKAGHWGIRIENLVVVTQKTVFSPYRDEERRPMLAFDTISLAPIDARLIEPALLCDEEIIWLDAYHARVRRELGPLLDEATRAWLHAATEPLSKR